MLMFQQYAAEYRKLGREAFAFQFGRPAIVGIQVGSRFDEQNRKPGKSTQLVVRIEPDLVSMSAKSFVGRAWLVDRQPHSPKTRPILAGRGSDNDLVIPDQAISKTHCQFEFAPGGVVLVSDAGSSNGTFVNKVRVDARTPVPLKQGDTLSLGRFEFQFYTRNGFLGRVIREAGFP